MNFRFHRNAVFVALLAIGVAGAVDAQTGSTSGSTSGSTATQGPGTGSTGMDKGAGTAKSATGSAASAKSDAAKSTDAKLSRSERNFIETAAKDGLAEVQLGKLAMDKAHDPAVKDFGRKMANDHAKANDQLKQLASTKGVTLPTEPDSKHKRLADRLGKLSGQEFDRAYMKEMVDEHEKDVKAFRDMAKSAKDTELRSFASTTLPVLEEHLRMAEGAQSAHAKGSTSTAHSGTSGSTASGAHPSSSAASSDTGSSSAAAGTSSSSSGTPAGTTSSRSGSTGSTASGTKQ